MKTRTVLNRLGFVLVALVLLTLSAGMAWATAADYEQRGLIPENVIVAGQDVGGMTPDEARAVISEAVEAPLLKPVAVRTDVGQRVCDPDDIVHVDIEGMLDEAYGPWRAAPFVARLQAAFYEPYSATVETTFTVDEDAIGRWIESVAEEVERQPANATLELVGSTPKITPAQYGRQVDRALARERLAAAVIGEKRDIYLPVKNITPQITEDDFGRVIVVDLSSRRLRLYDGDDPLQTWSVAIGTPGFPTPQGRWEIVLKRYAPTWINPGSDWAKDMPDRIEPGPTNPLGLRALNLNASGIRIHGTSNINSIGSAASHGCVRMRNSDVVNLFDMVEVGTPVFVVP